MEDKLKEVYEISQGEKTKVPYQSSNLRFSDNSSAIGIWINNQRSKIIELSYTNEYAKFIAEAKGWLDLSFEDKLKEIYIVTDGNQSKVPTYGDSIRFKDDSSTMGHWINSHKSKIIELSVTNEYAKYIAEAKGWFKSSFGEKLKEIYIVTDGNQSKIPITGDSIRFKDNSSTIGRWIFSHKSKIIELSDTNKYARFIAEGKGWIDYKNAKEEFDNVSNFNKVLNDSKEINNGRTIY